jgi:hypothetical protein
MEPLKSKESSVILSSMKTIFKRKYLDLPYASMTNDDGTEFKGEFHKYLVNNDILHKITLVGRHRSNANVESLNRQLGRFLNGYMNSKEVQTGKPYREWTDIIDTLRKELNKIRVKSLPKNPRTHEYKILDTLTTTPKYKVNDMVYRALDEPRNALNEKQSGKFRESDNRWDEVPRKVTKILYYSGDVPYRYMLSGIHQASYAEYELMPAPEDVTEEVAEIKAVLDRQYDRKEKTYSYHLWMYEEKKKNAGWYLRTSLVNDIGLYAVEELDNIFLQLKKDKNLKLKAKKAKAKK